MKRLLVVLLALLGVPIVYADQVSVSLRQLTHPYENMDRVITSASWRAILAADFAALGEIGLASATDVKPFKPQAAAFLAGGLGYRPARHVTLSVVGSVVPQLFSGVVTGVILSTPKMGEWPVSLVGDGGVRLAWYENGPEGPHRLLSTTVSIGPVFDLCPVGIEIRGRYEHSEARLTVDGKEYVRAIENVFGPDVSFSVTRDGQPTVKVGCFIGFGERKRGGVIGSQVSVTTRISARPRVAASVNYLW